MEQPERYDPIQPVRRPFWWVLGHSLFGNTASRFGWLWLVFSLVFVLIFGLNADVSAILFALNPLETTGGVVVTATETNASENEIFIYAYDYTYRVEKLETQFSGVSYSTGQQFSPQQTVAVEYLARNPRIARIAGTRRAEFSGWVLPVVLIFPLVGLGLLFGGIRTSLKANQ